MSAALPQAVFVRHVASVGNRKKLMKGIRDYKVDAEGKRESRRLAKTIVRHKPTVVITSPLERAKCLGKDIADEAGIPLKVDPKWLPIDLGKWTGESSETGEKKLAKLPADKAPPGGETKNHFLKTKVRPAFEDIKRRIKRGERPVVVTHSRNTRSIRHGLFGGKPGDVTKGGPGPGGQVMLRDGKLSASETS
jgi:broad specificity phosphatase PhoE